MKSPAFQFYAKDWLSSLTIMIMPPEYEGAYIRLLAYCWDSGDCSLPDDDIQLSVLSRLNEGWFNGGSAMLRKCFPPHPRKPGFLTNIRLLGEADKQAAWSNKSSMGGKRSAAKRAESKQQFKGGSTTVAKCLQPNGNITIASASASALKEEAKASPPTPTIPEWVPEELWKDFMQVRERMRSPNTHRAIALLVNDLAKLRDEGYSPQAIIEQSIKRGWKSFYPLKGDNNANHRTGNTEYSQPTKQDRLRAAAQRAAVNLGLVDDDGHRGEEDNTC